MFTSDAFGAGVCIEHAFVSKIIEDGTAPSTSLVDCEKDAGESCVGALFKSDLCCAFGSSGEEKCGLRFCFDHAACILLLSCESPCARRS